MTAGHSYNGHHPPCNNHSNVERTSASTLGAQLINHPDRRSFSPPRLGSTCTVCRQTVNLESLTGIALHQSPNPGRHPEFITCSRVSSYASRICGRISSRRCLRILRSLSTEAMIGRRGALLRQSSRTLCEMSLDCIPRMLQSVTRRPVGPAACNQESGLGRARVDCCSLRQLLL